MDGYSLFDVFLIVGLFHGILIIIALQCIPHKNTKANTTLSLLLGVAIIMLLGRIALFKIELASIWRFAVFVDVIIFLTGPLYYTYVRRLLIADTKVYRLSSIHFIPVIVHVLLFISTLRYNVSEYTSLYDEGKLFWQFLTVETAGLISLVSYIVASMKIILGYKKREQDEKASLFGGLHYLKFFTFLLLGISFLWGCSIISTYIFNNYLGYLNYSIMWFCIPLIMYLVGYFGLKNPSIFKISVKKESRQRLKKEEIEVFKKRMSFFMEEETLFKDPDLTLKKLADKMSTSSNNISWLLNNVYKVSFYEYVNRLRINSFLEHIEAGEHQKVTLLAIAYDVGFNSKSTFNKVFKEIKGMTPSNYLKENVA